MLNTKALLIALSLTLTLTDSALATSDVVSHGSASVEITWNDVEEDETLEELYRLVAFVDSLGAQQQQIIGKNLMVLQNRLVAAGKNATTADAHQLMKGFTVQTARQLGGRDAKALFSHVSMTPFVLAVQIDDTDDWVDAVVDTGLDYGAYADDVDALSDGEFVFGCTGAILGALGGFGVGFTTLGPIGGLVGAVEGAGLGWKVGENVGSIFDNTLVEGDTDGDGEVDSAEENIE